MLIGLNKNSSMLSLILVVFLSSELISAQSSDSESDSSVTRTKSVDIRSPERRQFGTVTVGPSFTSGLRSDTVMLNLTGALQRNFSDNLAGKVFADLNVGPDADAARFMTFGVGADIYPNVRQLAGSTPYLTADVGFATTRNGDGNVANGLGVGGGGGLRLLTSSMSWDVNLHYSLLTTQNQGGTPSVLALRAGVNF